RIYADDIENGIFPMNETDGQIFLTLLNIIKKLGGENDLIAILERYKSVSDDETYDMLMSYYGIMPEQLKNVKYMLNIGDDITLSIGGLYSFTKQESYSDVLHRQLYDIVINKSQDPKIPYANTTVSFATEEARDTEFNRIKEKLREFSNIMFI